MADQKVSDLPSLNGADVDPADLLYIIDSSAGSAGSKKITVGQYQLAPVSGGTANTVVYLNGSKVESSSAALTFDGSNLGIGTSSPGAKLDAQGATSTEVRSTSTSAGGAGNYAGFRAVNGGGAAAIFGSGTTAGNFAFTDELPNAAFVGSLGNNPLQLVTNSAARATIDTSGNLGLGVTPSAWSGLKSIDLFSGSGGSFCSSSGSTQIAINSYYNGANWIYKSNGFATRYEQLGGNGGASSHAWFTAPSGTAGNAISFTQAVTIASGGDLLVGTTGNANNYKTHILTTGAGAAIGIFQNNATTPYGINVYYGSASPNNSNANTSFLYCNDLTTLRIQLASNGGIINYQANNSNLSDRREKTDFAPAKSYLDTICAIPVQTFKYIDQNLEDDPGLTLGVVAQDVQAVAPELVMESNWGTEDNPKMRLSIYQTDLQYALMKAIQELKAQNDELRARVAALESA